MLRIRPINILGAALVAVLLLFGLAHSVRSPLSRGGAAGEAHLEDRTVLR